MVKRTQKPPLLARRLFRRMGRYMDNYHILCDVEEVYHSMREKKGTVYARLWYWHQCIFSWVRHLILTLTWSTIMLKNYLKVAVRNIIRHKTYYALNIVGLGLGMAFLIFTLVHNGIQFGFDRFHENADSLFSVVKTSAAADNSRVHSAILPYPMLQALMEDFPEIEKGTRYMPVGRRTVRANEQILYEDRLRYVDPSFLSMFSFEMIEGDPATVLSEPFSAVLSKNAATRYFGSTDPIGKTLTIDNETDVIVHGILDEPPVYSSIRYNILVSFSTLSSQNQDMGDWESEECMIMLQLNDQDSRGAFEEKLPAFVGRHYAADNHFVKHLYLYPLTAFHLHSMHIDSFLNCQLPTACYIFYGISIILLIVACFNFINLATAKSLTRMKEMGIRAVVGAKRPQLIRQFLIESIVVALISVPAAVILYEMCLLPYFTSAVGAPTEAYSLFDNAMVLYKIMLTSVILGIFAGLYPALTASRFHVGDILKENNHQGTGGTRLRKVLIVSQFVVSITAIVMTFLFGEQREHLLRMDLGYDRENVVVLRTNRGASAGYEIFRDRLMPYENVVSVSASRGLVARWNPQNQVVPEGKDETEAITMNTYGVNTDFIESFKMQVLGGRGFSRHFQDENSLLINEKAIPALGWDDPIGKTLRIGDHEGTIIGVVKDFNVKELFWDIIPSVLFLETEYLNYFYVRVLDQDNTATIDQIRTAWEESFPDHPFVHSWLVDEFKDQNGAIYGLQGMFALIGFITGFYALFGIIGLSMYSVLRRSKEIGIRKVFGASSGRILKSFYTEYVVLFGIGCIIAFPITHFFTAKLLDLAWSSSTDIKLEVFAFVYLFILLIVSLSVWFQTHKAATANPVDTLKYE